MRQVELITRSWTDLNRKVQSAGLWGLITLVVSGLLNAFVPEADVDAETVIHAVQGIINAAAPLVPVIAAYMTREEKQT